MTKADDVYLEDITENTLDFAPEVADSLGMSLSEYLKLSLPQRIDLTEKFIWKKKQGGFVNGYQSEGTVKTDDKKQALDFLTNTAKDAAKGLAEESEVYRIAENIVDDNKYLFGTVNAILNKELGVSFDVGKDKQIGFTVNPEEKKSKLGFKMSFDTGDIVKGGFLTKETLQKQTKKLTKDFTIADTLDEYEKTIRTSGGKAGTIDDALRAFNQLKKQLTSIFGNEINLIKTVDLNNETAIRNILNAAKEKDWWYTGKKGAQRRNFYRGVSALMGYQTGDIGVKGGPTHEWIKFRKKQKGTEYKTYIDYEGDRPVRFKKSAFKKALQEIENVTDFTRIKEIPKGTVKRFGKIVALTGIRPEHLAGLSVNDINLDNGLVSYTEYKGTGKAKTTYYQINEAAKRIFKEQLGLQSGNKTGRVFYASESQFSTKFSHLFSKANIGIEFTDGTKGRFQLYDFRRLQKARMMEMGLHQSFVDMFQGHSYKGPYSGNIAASMATTDPDLKKKLQLVETNFWENSPTKNKAAQYLFTGSSIEEIKAMGLGQPKFTYTPKSAEELKTQLDNAFSKSQVKGGGASIDAQGRGRKWTKKAKTAGIIAGILGATKTKAATIAPYVIPGPIDAPIMLAVSEYGKRKNPPGYSEDSVSLFEEMQGRYDELKKVYSIGDRPLGLSGFKEREFEKRLSDTEQSELDDLQAFMDDLNMSEEESKKLIKDTKKQYYDKYIEAGIEEGKTPPEHFKGMMQFYPEGYGQEQAG